MAVDSLEDLVEFCIPDPIERVEWSMTIQFYREAMVQLRQKEDLTNEEIFDFQWNIDQFGQH
jgi:hypothetical protein